MSSFFGIMVLFKDWKHWLILKREYSIFVLEGALSVLTMGDMVCTSGWKFCLFYINKLTERISVHLYQVEVCAEMSALNHRLCSPRGIGPQWNEAICGFIFYRCKTLEIK